MKNKESSWETSPTERTQQKTLYSTDRKSTFSQTCTTVTATKQAFTKQNNTGSISTEPSKLPHSTQASTKVYSTTHITKSVEPTARSKWSQFVDEDDGAESSGDEDGLVLTSGSSNYEVVEEEEQE